MRDIPLMQHRVRSHHRVRLRQMCGCLFEPHLFGREVRVKSNVQVPVFVEISARCAGCGKPYRKS